MRVEGKGMLIFLLRGDSVPIFIDHLLCARHCARLFACVVSLILTTPSWVEYYYVHFTNKETEAQRKHAPNLRAVSQSKGFLCPFFCLLERCSISSATGNRVAWIWNYNPETAVPQQFMFNSLYAVTVTAIQYPGSSKHSGTISWTDVPAWLTRWQQNIQETIYQFLYISVGNLEKCSK